MDCKVTTKDEKLESMIGELSYWELKKVKGSFNEAPVRLAIHGPVDVKEIQALKPREIINNIDNLANDIKQSICVRLMNEIFEPGLVVLTGSFETLPPVLRNRFGHFRIKDGEQS